VSLRRRIPKNPRTLSFRKAFRPGGISLSKGTILQCATASYQGHGFAAVLSNAEREKTRCSAHKISTNRRVGIHVAGCNSQLEKAQSLKAALLLPRRPQKQISCSQIVFTRFRFFIQIHHLPSAGGRIRRPLGQARSIRVATAREVRPVLLHLRA
jgi:hypothetical protein